MFLIKIHSQDELTYLVTGTKSFPQDVTFNFHQFREVSEIAYTFVNDHIDSNDITFSKEMEEITVECLQLEAVDELVKIKGNALYYYRTLELDKAIDSDFYLTFLEYIQLNNYMCSMGYFFTSDNREEKYLEILNTGDVDLIEKLEDFLNILDDISKFDDIISSYKKLKHGINEANNIKQVEKAFKKIAEKDLKKVLKLQ